MNDYINILILKEVPNVLKMYTALSLTTTGFCVIVQSIFVKVFEKSQEIDDKEKEQELSDKNNVDQELARAQP